jgi:exosortase family protein XrtM
MVVDKVTVEPSAWLISSIWPEHDVHAKGSRIISTTGNINVLRGCEGTETLLLLIAAVLAAGQSLRSVVVGIAIGSLLIYLVNQLRITMLFWVVANQRSSFELAHGYIAPLFVIGLAAIYYLFWLRHINDKSAATK